MRAQDRSAWRHCSVHEELPTQPPYSIYSLPTASVSNPSTPRVCLPSLRSYQICATARLHAGIPRCSLSGPRLTSRRFARSEKNTKLSNLPKVLHLGITHTHTPTAHPLLGRAEAPGGDPQPSPRLEGGPAPFSARPKRMHQRVGTMPPTAALPSKTCYFPDMLHRH